MPLRDRRTLSARSSRAPYAVFVVGTAAVCSFVAAALVSRLDQPLAVLLGLAAVVLL